MKILIVATTLLLIFTACGTKKSSSTVSTDNSSSSGTIGSSSLTKIDHKDYKTDSLLVRIELGACFGQCPIEKFSIFASGSISYEGINFVDNVGDYKGSIKKKEVEEIYNLMAKLPISSYPEKFGQATFLSLKNPQYIIEPPFHHSDYKKEC